MAKGVQSSPATSIPGVHPRSAILNIIYPNKVQIIGTEELNYLDGLLDSRQRWETIEKIMAYQPTALLVTRTRPSPAT